MAERRWKINGGGKRCDWKKGDAISTRRFLIEHTKSSVSIAYILEFKVKSLSLSKAKDQISNIYYSILFDRTDNKFIFVIKIAQQIISFPSFQGLNRYVDKITGSFVCRATRGPVINRHTLLEHVGVICVFSCPWPHAGPAQALGGCHARTRLPRSDDNWRGLIRKTKRHISPPLTWTYGFGFRNNSSNGN